MAVALITGSCGLVGAASARAFAALGFDVVGIDNDLRQSFFGAAATTVRVRRGLEADLPSYEHHAVDVRDQAAMGQLFSRFGRNVAVVVHAAAQPSHDWAATGALTDFSVNAMATAQLLDLVRTHAPGAVFIFTSTNKVYGDLPNSLPLVEMPKRVELSKDHPYSREGIPETFSIDQSMHSLFGASKLAADILVQEYARYFGIRTAVFRAGCITGANHAATELHGFLAYLLRCAVNGTRYSIIGYGGKQVRDIIHADDLVQAFVAFCREPREGGSVYNIGGGRTTNCSVLEAVELAEARLGRSMVIDYVGTPRRGDHQWWITDTRKFRSEFPSWHARFDLAMIAEEIIEAVSRS